MYLTNNDCSLTSSMSGLSGIPGELTTKKIQDGAPGIRQTVQHIIRLCRRDATDPAVVAIAQRMKDARSDERTVHNCFDYVVQNIPYKDDTKMALKAAIAAKSPKGKQLADEGTEFLIAPKFTLTRRWIGGDCDDLTNALGCLLISPPIGFGYYCRIIAWKPGEGFSHINGVGEIPDQGKYLALDPVMKSSGFGKEKRGANVTQEFFRVK
jgi:hypothetical protein